MGEYGLLELPTGAIRSVTLPPHVTFHVIDADGSRVVLDEPPGPTKTTENAWLLLLADVATGTVDQLDDSSDGYTPFYPAISGDHVAWSEIRDPVGDGSQGLDWRLMLKTLKTGTVRTLASGHAFAFPVLALDGDDLVYAFPDDQRLAESTITVMSASDGRVKRTIRITGVVYQLGVSNGAIAFTAGTADPRGFVYATQLLLVTPESSQRRALADNAYEVSFDDGRIAWGQDSPDGAAGGLPQHKRIWSAAAPLYTPEPLSPSPGSGDENVQDWPVSGGGLVTWGSERKVADVFPVADQLAVWSPSAGPARLVAPTRLVIGSSTSSGWLVWVEESEPAVVKGLPLDAIPDL